MDMSRDKIYLPCPHVHGQLHVNYVQFLLNGRKNVDFN